MTLYSFIVHLSFCSYMSADNMFSTYWGLIKVDRYRKTELYCFFKIKLLKGIQICVCVCVGVRGSVTWPVLDNRPLHALISTCVKQWLLGDRDGLTQEEISAKHRTGTKRWKKTGGGGSRKHASMSCRRCVCVWWNSFSSWSLTPLGQSAGINVTLRHHSFTSPPPAWLPPYSRHRQPFQPHSSHITKKFNSQFNSPCPDFSPLYSGCSKLTRNL